MKVTRSRAGTVNEWEVLVNGVSHDAGSHSRLGDARRGDRRADDGGQEHGSRLNILYAREKLPSDAER